ncbi:AAA family ATPase [Shewanella sp. A32]|uniref:AAA family ATPase n=1 Tax=Shewanella sp. A32 TaxID=3031327 RepID=UPI0023B9FEE1|nr:AAA family ATPase [Shewanella sp. A32]MDF0535673.1 AAA family ATPase [Shewanella sp. A32]
MDKPLELLVSDVNESAVPNDKATITMSFPITALLLDSQKKFLPHLEKNLDSCINLTWEKTADITRRKTTSDTGRHFNLILLVLPDNTVQAEAALQCAASYGVDIVILGQDSPQTVLRLAFQYGVSDFIPLGADDVELFQALQKISLQLSETAKLSPVLAVVNGKGGAGASFIAACMAVIAAKMEHSDLALLDTDLQYGSLAHILGLEPNYFIAEALQSLDDMDEIALKSAMTSWNSLHLLAAAPFSLMNAREEIKLNKIYDLIWKCRQHYSQVIIDFSRGLEAWNAELLRNADLLVVTQQNLAFIRETQALVHQLVNKMGISKDRIHLLVNRYDKANSAIKLSDIKNVVGVDSVFVVSNDFKLASECVDLGLPITQVAKRQQMFKDLTALTTHFLPIHDSQEKNKSGFLSRLFGK